MGSVRRLQNGHYEARYRDPQGGSRSRTFRTKAEARRFLDGNGADLQRGEWTDPRLGRIAVERWVEQWWATTTNLRPSTRARDRHYLDLYVLPYFGKRQLADVNQLDVRAWVADLSSRGLAPATVTKAYQLLGKVMSAGVDGGLIAATPCRRVPLPRIEAQEMRFLTPAEVGHLAEAIDER